MRIRSLVRPGSADLVELYTRQRDEDRWLANDTSENRERDRAAKRWFFSSRRIPEDDAVSERREREPR